MGLMNYLINNEKNKIYRYRNLFVNKSGFGKLADENIENLVNEIINQFHEITLDIRGYYNGIKTDDSSIDKLKAPSEGCKKASQKNIFSARIEKNNIYKTSPEDNLERMIKLSGQKLDKEIIYENQIAIPDTSQASHIDLLKKYDKTIEIVELKKWENGNNPPTWAVIECIKNLYMFLHLCKHLNNDNYTNAKSVEKFKNVQAAEDGLKIYNIAGVKAFKLIILAPKEYYEDTHFSEQNNRPELKNAFKRFCTLLAKGIEKDVNAKLKQNYDISIEVKYFELEPNTQDVYEKIKNNIVERHIAIQKQKNPAWEPIIKEQKSGNKTKNTGEIDLSNYIDINSQESDELFPIAVSKALIRWEDYIE